MKIEFCGRSRKGLYLRNRTFEVTRETQKKGQNSHENQKSRPKLASLLKVYPRLLPLKISTFSIFAFSVGSCEASRNSASGLLGAFVPECKEDGSYKEKQCHGSTGHCWCVDQSGKEIDGSRKSASEGEPKCGKRGHGYYNLTYFIFIGYRI